MSEKGIILFYQILCEILLLNVCCNFHAQFCQLLYLSAYLPNPIQWKKLGKLSMQKLFIKCWWNLSLNGIFAVVAGIFLTDINCEGSEKKVTSRPLSKKKQTFFCPFEKSRKKGSQSISHFKILFCLNLPRSWEKKLNLN